MRAPLHAGLLEQLLQLALQLKAAQELGGQQNVLFVGMDQRSAGRGRLGRRLWFAGADQTAFQFVEIRVAECIGQIHQMTRAQAHTAMEMSRKLISNLHHLVEQIGAQAMPAASSFS